MLCLTENYSQIQPLLSRPLKWIWLCLISLASEPTSPAVYWLFHGNRIRFHQLCCIKQTLNQFLFLNVVLPFLDAFLFIYTPCVELQNFSSLWTWCNMKAASMQFRVNNLHVASSSEKWLKVRTVVCLLACWRSYVSACTKFQFWYRFFRFMTYCAFNNMRTLKFKAQPTNAFFATVNQMFAGSSQLSTAAERAVIKSLCRVQTTKVQ